MPSAMYEALRAEIISHDALLHWITLITMVVLLVGTALVEHRDTIASLFLPLLSLVWASAVLRLDFFITSTRSIPAPTGTVAPGRHWPSWLGNLETSSTRDPDISASGRSYEHNRDAATQKPRRSIYHGTISALPILVAIFLLFITGRYVFGDPGVFAARLNALHAASVNGHAVGSHQPGVSRNCAVQCTVRVGNPSRATRCPDYFFRLSSSPVVATCAELRTVEGRHLPRFDKLSRKDMADHPPEPLEVKLIDDHPTSPSSMTPGPVRPRHPRR
jgi:hypothetical protein